MIKNFLFDKNHQSKFILFLYSIVIIATFIFIDRIFFSINMKNAILNRGLEQITEREKVLKSFIKKAELTLESIRDNEVFNKYVNNPNQKDLLYLEKQLLLISQINTDFMQLRYLDKNGMELVRIDRDKEFEKPYIVNKLQNKSNRYYFNDSINKEANKVWFSPLDLNIENGKVQKPYNPTIRAMLPINNNGKFDGILIINYFMNDFLNKFIDITLYKMILVDIDGNILLHYNNDKSWGLFKKEKFNILNEYTDSKNIFKTDIFKTDNFISKKLDIPIANKPIIILEPKEDYLEKEIKSYYLEYGYIVLIILILTFIASYFVTKILGNTLRELDTTKKLYKELESLQNKLSSILNTTHDIIIVLNNKKEIEFVNHEGVQTTLYKEDELLNKSIDLLIKGNKEFIEIFEQVLNNNEKSIFEISCFNKDGKKIALLISLIKIKDKDNVLFIGRNITELKKKEIELLEKDEILLQQSKIATMGEMLENIAHQWRQPLSIISTSASGLQLNLEMKNFDEKILDEGLDNIIHTTNYLSQTIEDFRDFFSNKKLVELFDVSSVIDKTLYLMTSRFTSSEINIQINKEKSSNVKGVKNELIQCLMNVFSNTRDEFEKKVSINHIKLLVINIYNDKDNVIIEILDNAGGIPDNIISKVFDAYFTTKEKSGTGIGLFMTKKIIEKSFNGKIEVKNKEFDYANKTYIGASFRIMIPMGE